MDLDQRAGLDVAAFKRQDNKTVGATHAAENMRGLHADRADAQVALIVMLQNAALKVGAPGSLLQFLTAGKVAITDTGLPGRPKNQAFLTRPKASGLPGFMAIFQKLTSPSLSSVCFT